MSPRVNPVPSVKLNGVTLAVTAADVAASRATVLDDFSVTWGRRRLTDHHEAGVAQFSVLDPAGTLAGQDMVGAPVEFWWTDPASGTSRRFFMGRVSKPAMTPRSPHTSGTKKGWWRGARMDFTAASTLAELGQIVTDESSWPDETSFARQARLTALAQPVVSNVIRPISDTNAPIAARNVNGQDALSLIKSFYDSGPAKMSYDPHNNIIKVVDRVAFTTTKRAYLTRNLAQNPDGVRITAASPNQEGPMFDADELVGANDGQLTRNVENAISRVTHSWVEAGVVKTFTTYIPDLEERLGRRSARYDTEFRDSTWANSAKTVFFDTLIYEGNAWAFPPLRYLARQHGGFPSMVFAELLISGREMVQSPDVPEMRTGLIVYLAGTPWPRLGVPPNVHIMGGVIRYRNGGWEPDFYVQPVHASGSVNGDIHADQLALHDGTDFTWDELSPAVTWNDLRYVANPGT